MDDVTGSVDADDGTASATDRLFDGLRAVDDLDYEDLFAHLEAIVAALEREDLPLERAVALYERGVSVSRAASARLDAAELRISRLTPDAEASLRDDSQ
ncbi:MAG: exodeoxyribonuclease VII small subunit [Chloroflexota bacterium]|nr:MAG: exodeoxyribonuclease VII small subunit [Chloroflexota bacterium]